MSRNRCIEIYDEQGKPIGHARVSSDASPHTIAAIEEMARFCVAGLRAGRLRSEREEEKV